MHIILTNDDGIYAEGLWALHRRFACNNTVTVIAPDRERSAVGHAITLHEPLRAKRVSPNGGDPGYAVSGTPADCIKLAVVELLDTKPDMVISGINPGANVGVNINYSGTVAAAKEATLYGVPAIAVSIMGHDIENYDEAAQFVQQLAEDVARKGLPFGTFLNVNIPSRPLAEVEGVRISRQGITRLSEFLEKRIDPRNRTYYWRGSDSQISYKNPDVDGGALSQNFISITPIKCDMTDYSMIAKLKNWNISKHVFNPGRN
jgi:5'-nucleotidase